MVSTALDKSRTLNSATATEIGSPSPWGEGRGEGKRDRNGFQNSLDANDGYDHLLFSYHGLPERHLRKSDTTGCHCLKVANCCEVPNPAHATCYRAQCFQTTKAFVARTGVPQGKYSIAFQSRLGRDPWMQPYADKEIERLARAGVKRLLVMCPAFVSDCLETLEEIGMRGRETFRRAGGEELTLIPCLNEHPAWIRTLERMVTSRWDEAAATRVRSAIGCEAPVAAR